MKSATWALLLAQGLFAASPERILFTRLWPNPGLFIANADGSEEKPLLAEHKRDYNPAWSADGKWIVFTSERDGSAELYRVKPGDTRIERLTNHPAYDDQAAFSPTGGQIAFVSTRDDGYANIYTLDIRTKKVRAMTTGEGGNFRPAWSPDGRWIAFSSGRGSEIRPAKGRWENLQLADIYVIHPDGSGLKRIGEHGEFCGSPQFTRDSKQVIAYCMTAQETFEFRNGGSPGGPIHVEGNTRIVAIEIATGAARTLETGTGVKIFPRVLPTGEIAYVRKETAANGVFYNGTNKTGPQGPVRAPSWSPDGKQVVYAKALPAAARSEVRFFSRDPQFEFLGAAGSLPSFNPAGDQYVSEGGVQGRLALIHAETHGSQFRVIFRDPNRNVVGASWSPLGDSIIFGLGAFQGFMSFDPVREPTMGGAQVAIIKPDGTGFRELTSGRNNNGSPSFAPDGKRFVFRTMGPEGFGLRVMNLADGSITKLTDQYENFPVWSPRGDLVAFVRRVNGDYELFTIHPDGTGLKQMTRWKGNEAHLAFSPDGEWILFSSEHMGFKDEAVYGEAPQPYGEIFKMRYDGTGITQLTDNQWEDGGPGWAPKAR